MHVFIWLGKMVFNHASDAHMGMLSKHYAFIKNMIDGGVKYLSVMGTMHEIGYYEGCVDENTPTHPLSMYGIAKNALREAFYYWQINRIRL